CLAHLLHQLRALDGGCKLREQRPAEPLPAFLVVRVGFRERDRAERLPAGDEQLITHIGETDVYLHLRARQLAERLLREVDERLAIVAARRKAACELEELM